MRVNLFSNRLSYYSNSVIIVTWPRIEGWRIRVWFPVEAGQFLLSATFGTVLGIVRILKQLPCKDLPLGLSFDRHQQSYVVLRRVLSSTSEFFLKKLDSSKCVGLWTWLIFNLFFFNHILSSPFVLGVWITYPSVAISSLHLTVTN